MQSRSVASFPVVKFKVAGQGPEAVASTPMDDLLAVEEPLEIRIVYGPKEQRVPKNISVTMCTPGQEDELAAGFLFTEGIIHDSASIENIQTGSEAGNRIVTITLKEGLSFDPQKMERHFYTSSSCGVCGKSSIAAVRQNIKVRPSVEPVSVPATLLNLLPDHLRSHQAVFEQTGGLHASTLFNWKGDVLLTREDVGRHNALDKLIGSCLLKDQLPLDQHILLLSGRASFELIQKAAMAGIRMVAAVGAPSSLAVEAAGACGITLLGFLRDGRFNRYTGNDTVHII